MLSGIRTSRCRLRWPSWPCRCSRCRWASRCSRTLVSLPSTPPPLLPSSSWRRSQWMRTLAPPLWSLWPASCPQRLQAQLTPSAMVTALPLSTATSLLQVGAALPLSTATSLLQVVTALPLSTATATGHLCVCSALPAPRATT